MRPSSIDSQFAAALADRYELLRELGRGGMATVYLARDVRHARQVAIKVLHPELAAVLGAERFLAEIKTTANLQHPHILPLFDSGSADGQLFYVMPFVEGETLRARLERETQLPIAEAIQLAREVADALQHAHERGVIHRDIKPENILLQGGHALVADFGIALAVQQAGGQRMTQTGLSLGTPQYMAPEQAMGEKAVDARADIYALGAVTYEMLAGEPPFSGPTPQAIIAKVMTSAPAPLTALRAKVPSQVDIAIQHALEKLPADRFASAREFADAFLAQGSDTSSRDTVAHAASSKERYAVGLAVAAVILVGTTAWGWLGMRSTPPQETTKLDLLAPDATQETDVVISGDGLMLALTATIGADDAVFLRRIDGEPVFRKVAGSEGARGTPAFSPDNQWIVFRRRDSSFVKVSVNGGGTLTITKSPLLTNYPHWNVPDAIVGSTSAGVWRYPVNGLPPELLVANTGRYARMLPDGSGILFSRDGSLLVYDLATKEAKELVKGGTNPEYVSTGHLLYITSEGSLVGAPFDLRRHAITGAVVNLIEQVGGEIARRGYSVSQNGVLVYRVGARAMRPTRSLLASVALDGRVEPLELPGGNQASPRVSHDGRFLVYASQRRGDAEPSDIFVVDLASRKQTQITFSGVNYDPLWSPDDTRIVFTRGRLADGDLYEKPVDLRANERLVLSMPNAQVAKSWTPSGALVFESSDFTQSDLYVLDATPNAKPRPYLNASWSESDAQLSRDGALALYRSLESGSSDVWIREFPGGEGKWRVHAGTSARWSPDGQYVYFWRIYSGIDSLFRARIERTPSVSVQPAEPVLAFDLGAQGAANEVGWDFLPDGRHIVAAQPVASDKSADSTVAGRSPARYVVVLNWFAELKSRFGAAAANSSRTP